MYISVGQNEYYRANMLMRNKNHEKCVGLPKRLSFHFLITFLCLKIYYRKGLLPWKVKLSLLYKTAFVKASNTLFSIRNNSYKE